MGRVFPVDPISITLVFPFPADFLFQREWFWLMGPRPKEVLAKRPTWGAGHTENPSPVFSKYFPR